MIGHSREACIFESGRIVPTEFQRITGSGHQFFLETLGTLMESVRVEQLGWAAFGPWSYPDSRRSFRWDPRDDRRYAYHWNDPSGEEVRTEHGANLLAAFALPRRSRYEESILCEHGANLLAAFARPLFPLGPSPGGPRTTGFVLRADPSAFTWPIWRPALSVAAGRSLRAADGLDDGNSGRWRQASRGIAEG